MLSSKILRASLTNTAVPAGRRALTVPATFYYLENREEYKTVKPYHLNLPSRAFAEGLQTNEVSVPYHNVPVMSLRGMLDQFQLDRNGFQIIVEQRAGAHCLTGCVNEQDYDDERVLRSTVRPSVEDFLRRSIPGAQDAIAFSHQVRSRDQQFPRLPRGTDARTPQPVQGVHIDMTPDSARVEINDSLRKRGYSDISDRRWAIISVWRPLFGPLRDWPLALMDYTSFDNSRDLVASDNVYLHKIRETFNVLWNESHRWYFLPDQQPNEVYVFKTFDTYAHQGHARACPHASFQNPLAPTTARPRRSFECLSVVLWPKGTARSSPHDEVLPSESLSKSLSTLLAEMGGGLE